MKILIVSQRYWPEPFRITDVAETLVKMGHSVTVLCGTPNLPQGYTYEEYKNGKNKVQDHNGVHIIRAKEIERRNDLFHRFLNYYSFPHYANKLVGKLDKDFDVVLLNELSPIMSVRPGIKYAKQNNKKTVMYEMDLWPESLLAGGIKKSSLIYNHYKKVASKIYSSCDKILVSTKEHSDYIKALPKCSDLDIDYLPQYAESIFEDGDYKTIENGVIDLVFAGNIGKAQSIDTIIKAANELKDDQRFMFHIVGGGSELGNNKKLAERFGLTNVIFYGPKPIEEMPTYYKLADTMLVTLEDSGYANMTIPGKVQSYMACGKPIIGAINGVTSNLINDNHVGIATPAGDYFSLAKTIVSLDDDSIKTLSNNSKSFYKNFKKEQFFKILESYLKKFA